jgi:GTPase SAR1 family protein
VYLGSGLDNAGKTTIVKKIMGEDVNTVSPTLGFIIKTIDYDGWVLNPTGALSYGKKGCANLVSVGTS